MLGPLREAVLARIAACASKEEAKALKDYYSRVIDYNCTGWLKGEGGGAALVCSRDNVQKLLLA